MSDPILPAPEADTAAPLRKSRGKWFAGIALAVVLVLVIGGAAYGVRTAGDAKAEDYAKALDAWNDQRSDLLGAP